MNTLSDSASPLYEKVKDFVLGNIGSGKWARNSRLPSENELVSALGVSRMTVHRALRELTSEGHLRRIQGGGHLRCAAQAPVDADRDQQHHYRDQDAR